MKDELQNKLVDILTAIQGAAGKASDFALSQLPDIAQSYVAYGRAVTTLGVVVGALLAVYAGWAMAKALRDDTPYQMESLYGISGVSAGIVGLVFVVANTSSALMVWFAPKVWLLKEIANLIK